MYTCLKKFNVSGRRYISFAGRDETEEIILMNIIMKKELRPCATL